MNVTNQKFKVISRHEWHPEFKSCAYASHKPVRIVFHHSWKPTKRQYKGVDTVKGIYRYHTANNGWDDIAYHFIISPDGKEIFKGRPATAIGAHCGGKTPASSTRHFGNTGSIGILLIGDYDTEIVEEGAKVALMQLIESLWNKYDMDKTEVYGHCDCMTPAPKSCPGKNLYIELFGKNRYEKSY